MGRRRSRKLAYWANAVPVVLPIGAEDTFEGIIDLVDMKAVYYDDTKKGVTIREEEIPAELLEEVDGGDSLYVVMPMRL